MLQYCCSESFFLTHLSLNTNIVCLSYSLHFVLSFSLVLSISLFPLVSPQLVVADGCPYTDLGFCRILTVKTEFFLPNVTKFLSNIVGSLPFSAQHHEAVVVLNWGYINKTKFNCTQLYSLISPPADCKQYFNNFIVL